MFSIDASLIKVDVDKKKRMPVTSRSRGHDIGGVSRGCASTSQPSIRPRR